METSKTVKIIFHIDMNAFFCSVACLINPQLRGKVFAIGRENSYRGVLSTASYEARALGIHSAMSLKEAYDKVPNLIVVSLDRKYIKHYHQCFVKLLEQYSNLVEVASVDEAYMDVTELAKTRHPLVIAKEIQARLLKEVGLSCSIGIAPTLFLAKMASDMKKPLGITVLRKRDVVEKLYPLSVSEIFGIGKKTYPLLQENEIKTIKDFMSPENEKKIIDLIGNNIYESVQRRILGKSSNQVDPFRYSECESISTSTTFDRIIDSATEVLYELRRMTREVIRRLKKAESHAKTVTITLRTTNFKTTTRSKTMDSYFDDFTTVFEVIADLVELHYHDEPLRLIGAGVSNIVPSKDLPREYNLFTIANLDEREQVIEAMIQNFQKKFGQNALFQSKKRK